MSTHLEAIGCGEKIETIPKKEVFALEWISTEIMVTDGVALEQVSNHAGKFLPELDPSQSRKLMLLKTSLKQVLQISR